MPYGRKYNGAAKKLQRYIRRRRGARAQSNQLVKTNKRINRIQSQLRREVNKFGLFHEVYSNSFTLASIMVQPAFAVGVNSPGWANCFATSAAAINATRARLGRCHIQMAFTCGTEPQPVTFTVLHVKLTPRNAENLIQDVGTDFSGLAEPLHYIRGAPGITAYAATTNGRVMLNPDYFIVKKKWTFCLTNRQVGLGSSQTTNGFNTYKNISYTIPLGYTLGLGTGSWGDANADENTPAAMKNWILVFTDNSLLDAESSSFSCLMQCTARAIE